MIRLRIISKEPAQPAVVWLERRLSARVINESLEEIKWQLGRSPSSHYCVIADNGEVYSILWRT